MKDTNNNPADGNNPADDLDLGERAALLAGMALGDLSNDEDAELARNWNENDRRLCIALERTAATVQIALDRSTPETMPSQLRQRIISQGQLFLLGGASEAVVVRAAEPPTMGVAIEGLQKRVAYREWVAWLACAAAIAIALGIWSTNNSQWPGGLRSDVTRSALIARATDLVQVDWTDGKTPWEAKVTGDVVWSNSAQQGFMRFVNMPVNDPSKEQYQLWIIDPARDDEPIDGGVFDVSDSTESIIAIRAKLQVLTPKAFAVTIEKPGGVVVSTQERLPLLAMVP